tara:strand:+ start:1090 stop:1296 length:207 start_codon:yes stop_codon:yes gene_type:complete
MKTLLQELESKGVNVNPQCREGYCGSCRCKIAKGEVTYITEPIAYVNDDEVLPCIAKADLNVILDTEG